MKCPMCSSKNVRVEVITNSVKKEEYGFGCLIWLFLSLLVFVLFLLAPLIGWISWLFLGFCFLGLIMIFPFLKSSQVLTKGIKIGKCDDCGNEYALNDFSFVIKIIGCFLVIAVTVIIFYFRFR